jgi:ABC-type ATPase with predicted acetyltransferase domain
MSWGTCACPADPGSLVAAPEPICPRCGEGLLSILELKGASRDVCRAA